MFLIFPNLAGIEYTKTFATRSKGYPRIFEVAYGGGIILLQKYDSPSKNRIIKAVIRKGQKIIIPSGYTCVIINSRQN